VTAITIGNFDGVHLGHRRLIERAREAAGNGGRVVVLTFDPHPRAILNPDSPSTRLTASAQREEWLVSAGADEVRTIHTTRELLQQSPEEFFLNHVMPHSPAVIVEGEDFRFGHRRMGTVQTLRELAKGCGSQVMVVEPVEARLTDQSLVRVSSSLVRWLLERGRVADAAILLGKPYELRCKVVQGDQRGRHIGFPTMNLEHGDYLLPADGIYAGRAMLPDGRVFAAAVSVGVKPTFGFSPRVCEAHLINYLGSLDEYGFVLKLQIEHWVRDQLKYDDVQALIHQMGRDVQAIGRRVQLPKSINRKQIGCVAT
jgi:riboflavin kinase/FMN adenylyltransferase